MDIQRHVAERSARRWAIGPHDGDDRLGAHEVAGMSGAQPSFVGVSGGGVVHEGNPVSALPNTPVEFALEILDAVGLYDRFTPWFAARSPAGSRQGRGADAGICAPRAAWGVRPNRQRGGGTRTGAVDVRCTRRLP